MIPHSPCRRTTSARPASRGARFIRKRLRLTLPKLALLMSLATPAGCRTARPDRPAAGSEAAGAPTPHACAPACRHEILDGALIDFPAGHEHGPDCDHVFDGRCWVRAGHVHDEKCGCHVHGTCWCRCPSGPPRS